MNERCSSIGCVGDKNHEGPHVLEFHGVTSTKIPRFELIPKSALESLALRFELGIERKGDGAWNALTRHKAEALKDSAFVIERLSHCISHCYDAIAKVMDDYDILEREEDAGAILFAGSVLAEYKRLRKDALQRSDGKKGV